jgi:hypothetical protein
MEDLREKTDLEKKITILERGYMNTKLIGEPLIDYMFRKHPEKFEKMEDMNIKDIKPKKIFKITHSFIFTNETDIAILPVRYIDYGNFGKVCKCRAIEFPHEKDEIKSVNRISDLLTNVYNISDWRLIKGEEELLHVIGTVWEERKDRFFPIVLDEGSNLMIDLNIEDPKIKDLMNYKLKQIDSLKVDALKMKMPEKVADLENGMSSYKFLGSIDRKIAFDIPAERQDYTCFGCGYRPKSVDKQFGIYDQEEGRKLEPHRIVHNCFLGDYDRYNVVILCEKCHNLEYKYFKVYWNRFFENGKLMEWTKLIEESFEFFKDYLVWLHLRK